MSKAGESSSLFSRLIAPFVKRNAPQPANDDREGWKTYWTKHGQPWRVEPEIELKRQAELGQRRKIVSDIEKGLYPFSGMKLNRADIEWLLATHESRGMYGPIDWNDEKQREREGLNLCGADLGGNDASLADLEGLPLARLRGSIPLIEMIFANEEQRTSAVVLMQRTNLSGADLRGADLLDAHLERANLNRAHLEGSDLRHAHLEDAWLTAANLKGADLTDADLSRTWLQGANLENVDFSDANLKNANLMGANLKGANFSGAQLGEATLCWAHLEGADVRRVARYSIPGSARKNRRNVLGSTAYPESKDNGGQEPADNAMVTRKRVR